MPKKLEVTEHISDAEFFRLYEAHRRRTDPSRRSPERVERPIDIIPTMHGHRTVTWPQYEELVLKGEAKQPVGPRR